MKKIVALTTTGTSLFTNVKYQKNCAPLAEVTESDIEQFITDALAQDNSEKISAEINAIEKLDKFLEGQSKKIDVVHFMYSDTEIAKRCKKHIENFVSHRGYSISSSIVKGLNYKEKQFKIQGLRNFINTLTNLISEYKSKGYDVLMNATAGFKSETALATLICQLMQVESFYIYESFNEIIQFPFLPLSLGFEYWSKYIDLFKSYSKGMNKEEASKLQLPKEFTFLTYFDENESLWKLNIAGEAFYLSLLSEQKIYFENQYKKVFKKGTETTLWNKVYNINVTTLNDIPDNDVKTLLRRIIRFNFVRSIEFVDFHEVGKNFGETRIEYKTKNEQSAPNYLHYEIKTKKGKQMINIMVDEGFCDEFIELAGKTICL